ncbi:MAG: hypothetical protein HYX34_03770 [Actinobacteria bacterium]|nr:hypothetical protein [Actinomycetota bacterium]
MTPSRRAGALANPPIPGHGRRRTTIAVAALATVVASSCSWTSGDQYFVHWGPRVDVVIRQKPSFDLTLARGLFLYNNQAFASQMGNFRCNGNHSGIQADECVMRLLHERATVGGVVSVVWSEATCPGEGAGDCFDPVFASIVHDFRDAFGTVRGSVQAQQQVAWCLTLSAVGLKTNWTYRTFDSSDCRPGKHTWE